jgi:hypothetical protein
MRSVSLPAPPDGGWLARALVFPGTVAHTLTLGAAFPHALVDNPAIDNPGGGHRIPLNGNAYRWANEIIPPKMPLPAAVAAGPTVAMVGDLVLNRKCGLQSLNRRGPGFGCGLGHGILVAEKAGSRTALVSSTVASQ